MLTNFSAASYKVAFPEYITPETQVQARLIETAIHKDALSKVCNNPLSTLTLGLTT